MKNRIWGLLAFGLLAAPVGSAYAVTYYFSYGSDLVATISTSDGTRFDMSFLYAPAVAGTAFINDVFMLNTGTATSSALFSNLGPEDATGTYNANGFEGGPWNWRISFPMANNANRFLEGESTAWFITSTLTDWDLGKIHINAFLNGQSIKLTGCDSTDENCEPEYEVPEPGSLALLGLGLLGLGFGRRRKTLA